MLDNISCLTVYANYLGKFHIISLEMKKTVIKLFLQRQKGINTYLYTPI